MQKLLDEVKPYIEKIQKKDFQESFQGLLEITKKNPQNKFAFDLLGQIELHYKNYTDAISFFDKSLKLDSHFVHALFNKASAFKLIKKLEESEKLFEKVISLNPKIYFAYQNLGLVKKDLKKIDEAITLFLKCKAINENDFKNYYHLANCYKLKYDYDLAINYYKSSLKINPQHEKSLLNLGICYFDLLQLDESIECYNKVLSLNSKNVDAKYNKSLALLKNGNLSEGWNLYESRWALDNSIFKPLITLKEKLATKLKGNLFIWPEQGLGDEIMFSAIFNKFKNINNKIFCACDPRLFNIFSRSFPHIKFFDDLKKINHESFDQHISFGSLFGFFNIETFDIDKKKYLFPDLNNPLSEQLKKIKSENKNKKIIGLSWKSKNIEYGSIRSLSLNKILNELKLDDYLFINLQYGDVQSEIDQSEKKYGIKILTLADNFSNIDNLSTLISFCDKIITIDNTTVHLAGALGVETILLLPYSSDWRWLINSEKSYWYESVRILSQSKFNDWSAAFKNLNEKVTF